MRPAAMFLPDGDQADGRLHLQHGPIDLIIGVDSCPEDERQLAFAVAQRRFLTVLDELVGELPLLRSPAHAGMPSPAGSIARRMVAAVRPFADVHFITPMAAVAGAVADEILAAMCAAFSSRGTPDRMYVNNGGDIAVHLGPAAEFRIAIAREDSARLGHFTLSASGPSRGIATSGRGGRSLSFGIADSVTILAADAAAADAAASLVANAVDLPGHPLITRARAIDLVDDSDLGARLVVRSCGRLQGSEVADALSRGVARAEHFIAAGHIAKAALFLQDQGRVVPSPAAVAAAPQVPIAHPTDA